MSDEPRPGETWKWAWLWVTIVRVGPKTITYRAHSGSSNTRVPRNRFMDRFHQTRMTEPTDPSPSSGEER